MVWLTGSQNLVDRRDEGKRWRACGPPDPLGRLMPMHALTSGSEATAHPSSILRMPGDDGRRRADDFVADLEVVLRPLRRRSSGS